MNRFSGGPGAITEASQAAPSRSASESRLPRRAYWPTHIVGLQAGLTTPEIVRRAAAATAGTSKRRLRECEANFYLAEYHREHDRREDARNLLQAAADSCAASALEGVFAKAELKRLGRTEVK